MKPAIISVLLIVFSTGTLSQTTTKPDAGSTECQQALPIDKFLLSDDANAAKAAFISFRKALLDGDKRLVADAVRFPLDTVIDGYGVRFGNADELFKRYDEVFNPFVISVVRVQDPSKLTANWDGVSTSDNAVRFVWNLTRFQVGGISTRLEKPTGFIAEFLEKRKTCSPVVIEGRIVAYNWVSRTMPGFENIYVDHYIVDVSHVLKGELPQGRIRVDFWGVSHLAEYNLPDEALEPGHFWKFYLRPSGTSPVNEDVCRADVQESISFVDQGSGQEVEKKTAIVPVGSAQDQDRLTYVGLPCFEVNNSFFIALASN